MCQANNWEPVLLPGLPCVKCKVDISTIRTPTPWLCQKCFDEITREMFRVELDRTYKKFPDHVVYSEQEFEGFLVDYQKVLGVKCWSATTRLTSGLLP